MAKGKVPNQRIITIHKELADMNHKYTVNNLEALDEAAGRLIEKASFKLYIYLAKNQDKYNFNLSSSHFMQWASVGIAAYRTAFKELVEEGYLIKKDNCEDTYIFYDKSQINDVVRIENPEERVEEFKEALKQVEEHNRK